MTALLPGDCTPGGGPLTPNPLALCEGEGEPTGQCDEIDTWRRRCESVVNGGAGADKRGAMRCSVVQSQRADSKGMALKMGLFARNVGVGLWVMGVGGSVVRVHGWEYPPAGVALTAGSERVGCVARRRDI